VGEEVAVQRLVVGEQDLEVEGSLGGHELVEPDLAGRELGPLALAGPVVRVRPALTDPRGRSRSVAYRGGGATCAADGYGGAHDPASSCR
jgi:hypothetical protein